MKAGKLREGRAYTTAHGVVRFRGFDLHGFAVCVPVAARPGGEPLRLTLAEIREPFVPSGPQLVHQTAPTPENAPCPG